MDAAPWPNYKTPAVQKIAADFAKRSNGRYFDASGAYTYEAMLVIGDVLERAASTDPDAIVAAIKKTNFAGGITISNGPVIFNEIGDNPNASTALIQILGQKPPCRVAQGVRRGEVRVPAAEAVDGREGLRLRPAALRRASRASQGGQGAAVAAAAAALQARRGGADLRRAPEGLGGDGPARLRRRGLQRAPHLALRADELAQPDGRLGRPAHAADQAADLRQPAAAARPAPAGRGAGHAGLPVQRAHRVRLRPRHPARAQRLRRAAAATRARGSRRRGRSSAARGPRRCSPTPGQFWSYDNVAIWPRPVQQPHPPVWVPVTGSKETIEWAGRYDVPITPGLVPTRGLREDIIRYYARCLAAARPHADARPPDHPGQRLRGRQQGAGGEGGRTVHALLQPDAVQPRQHQRGRRYSATPAI